MSQYDNFFMNAHSMNYQQHKVIRWQVHVITRPQALQTAALDEPPQNSGHASILLEGSGKYFTEMQCKCPISHHATHVLRSQLQWGILQCSSFPMVPRHVGKLRIRISRISRFSCWFVRLCWSLGQMAVLSSCLQKVGRSLRHV